MLLCTYQSWSVHVLYLASISMQVEKAGEQRIGTSDLALRLSMEPQILYFDSGISRLNGDLGMYLTYLRYLQKMRCTSRTIDQFIEFTYSPVFG